MITVLVPVPILCDYSFNYDVAGNSVLFNNTPDVAATATVLWTFGDSTATSTINDPTYVYSAPGQYVVCFNVIDLANCGASPFISCDTVTIIGVSIADYNTSGVEVYPNPSSGSIAIDVRRNDIQTLDLLDEHGRVLYSSKQADLNERIAIQSLPKGVYLLHVTTASTVFSTKIIVL